MVYIFLGRSAPIPPALCPYQSDRPYSRTSIRPWYGRQLTGQKWSPWLHSWSLRGLKRLGSLFYPDSAAAIVPFVAGSHRLLPALLSTKPLPSGSVVCLVHLHPPADLFFYWQEGHVFVWLGIVPASIWQMG